MAFHECPECGLIHGDMSPQTNPEVEIARIQAESAYKIAQLQARADKHVAEVEAEAAVDVAESHAEAIVEALASDETQEDPEPAEGLTEPSEPVIVSTPIIDSGNDVDETEPPKRDETEHQDEEEKPKKSRGLGLW